MRWVHASVGQDTPKLPIIPANLLPTAPYIRSTKQYILKGMPESNLFLHDWFYPRQKFWWASLPSANLFREWPVNHKISLHTFFRLHFLNDSVLLFKSAALRITHTSHDRSTVDEEKFFHRSSLLTQMILKFFEEHPFCIMSNTLHINWTGLLMHLALSAMPFCYVKTNTVDSSTVTIITAPFHKLMNNTVGVYRETKITD